MGCFGNALWFVFGGLWLGAGWTLAGCFWCLTIVGIPIGRQCFKIASLAFFPFGKEVVYGGGASSTIANILWILLSGAPLALESLVVGGILCLSIVGIPFGRQCFKLARVALLPFGTEILRW